MRKYTLLAMAGLFLVMTEAVLGDDDETARIVSVSGTAVMKTAPDQVLWRIDLSDYDKDGSSVFFVGGLVGWAMSSRNAGPFTVLFRRRRY